MSRIPGSAFGNCSEIMGHAHHDTDASARIHCDYRGQSKDGAMGGRQCVPAMQDRHDAPSAGMALAAQPDPPADPTVPIERASQ